ncbi:MAG: bifunctional phosphoglucose/phosphomannose isomerase [Candidatus Aenigmarchaeota archaeon]|nr:bifunctional phosphoglucose/phosphomannose isomerase [Candidatus Aenigmarchaeota archaeon]NIP40683.1 bifunctional phosphoglucose/phosphomannose isomerase [Candidatus Aenigmarchaeota archaeon]NIQ18489.1 bifunctional phosphoglucose/phosphomannose isomerase [Candidatus Aenigmarchaeota archaeon]NIS73388.1 bifunctional phosphoglucose/phosphomannose isomerase [Candidatus Aenigmarchaeota archaeon]
MILDDIVGMMEVDRRNVLGTIRNFPEQCEEAIGIGKEFSKTLKLKKPKSVCICGMGGSAIAGDILRTWLRDHDIRVFRGHDLPGYVDKDSLVLISSYSGNTEETLSLFRQAVKRKLNMIGITSGGKLEKEFREEKTPFIKIPGGMQPRYAIAYLFFPLLVVLRKIRFIREGSDLGRVVRNLKETRDELTPDVRTKDNPAKRIAIKLRRKIPLIYGFGKFEAVALRAKAQFNENSKIHSFSDNFPELSHNAIVGWESPRNLSKMLAVIFIRDREEDREMQRRIEFTEDAVRNSGGSVIEIRSIYHSDLSRILSVMYMLNFVSIYLGILHRKDPSKTELLTDLKYILRHG